MPQHTTLHRMWHLFVEASVEYSFLFDVEKHQLKHKGSDVSSDYLNEEAL